LVHNRPHDVIRHVTTQYADRQQFKPDHVQKNDNGRFVVASANTDGLLYTISFDDGGMPMPSCERFDWKRFHLACKHFCAIFHLFPD